MDELSTSKFEFPGFRFHPTEEELLEFYLKNKIFGENLHFDIIGALNIYDHEPWELPGLAKIGEREWYFFVARDRSKHGNGGRPNRTTENGFWKATGSDRQIFSSLRVIGIKKTLVFYKGRAPRGTKTDWIMNEYRLPDACAPSPKDIVLCKIYRKATSLKVLEQRAAMEEEVRTSIAIGTPPPSPPPPQMSFCSKHEDLELPLMGATHLGVKVQEDEEEPLVLEEEIINTTLETAGKTLKSSSLQLPSGKEKLDLQLPKFSMDWTQESFSTLSQSPWLGNWSSPYAMF